MKTTIDLPESLLHLAKVTAVRRRTTLKDLVIEGLDRVIRCPASPRSPEPGPSDDLYFSTDAYGVPVLRRRGVTVTDSVIEKLREVEGI
jgi:hypothetical protein